MMSELIDRFRYRFDLWRRERREDLYGSPDGPVVIHDKRESIPQMAFRYTSAYLCILVILSGVTRLVGRYFAATRFVAAIVAMCIAVLLGLGMIAAFSQECIAKRKARAGASTSSNQSLEPTADPRM